MKKQGIGGKIGRWIEEFLKNRKFRVVVNECMSEEEDVISGVPQGTVLAAILFAIMISDIDDIEDIQRIFTSLLNQLSHSNLMFCLLFDPSDSI